MSSFNAIDIGRRVLAAEADALASQALALDATFARAVDLLAAAKPPPKLRPQIESTAP